MQHLNSAETVLDENLDMLIDSSSPALGRVSFHSVFFDILMGSPHSDTTEVYLTMII